MTGSALYQRTMAWYDANDRDPELQHKVWDPTPWMLDVYTGNSDDDRMRVIMDWARERFGDEAWPIHGKPGTWHRGGATVYGWTWFGFDTEERMREFQIKWGGHDQEHDGKPPEGLRPTLNAPRTTGPMAQMMPP